MCVTLVTFEPLLDLLSGVILGYLKTVREVLEVGKRVSEGCFNLFLSELKKRVKTGYFPLPNKLPPFNTVEVPGRSPEVF